LSIYVCPDCNEALAEDAEGRLACSACERTFAVNKDGITYFDDCDDLHNFFEKQAIERLDRYYAGFDKDRLADILDRRVLWEMDGGNKRVGIARKYWWEDRIGKLTGKSILEVGCGVNYLTPYFLLSDNDVVAFDICKESVEYTKQLLDAAGVPQDRLRLAVADARRIGFTTKFDVANISNVLHHIDDKPAALRRIHGALKDGGRLLIVEPNYYYPPRWIIETDRLDPVNFVKDYFVRNDLIEEGEKAIIFNDMVAQLEDAGFEIEHHFKDRNYLGYFTVYWMKDGAALARMIYALDMNVLA